MIIANSKRIRIPPSRTPVTVLSELGEGVIVGEYLFLDTYDTVRTLRESDSDNEVVPPIIACGGVLDIGATVDMFAAGACAVQLCSALDARGPFVLPLLREQLNLLGTDHKYKSLVEFTRAIRGDRDAWKAASEMARDFRIDEKASAETIFEDEKVPLECIKEALMEECVKDSDERSFNDKIEIPEDLKFVVSKGNVCVFLLGNMVVEENNLSPLEFESAGDFCKQLASPTFCWDFAILPESTLDFLDRERKQIEEKTRPIKIGYVACS